MSDVEVVAAGSEVEVVEIGGQVSGGTAEVTVGSVETVEVAGGLIEVEVVGTGTGVTGTTTATEVEVPVVEATVQVAGQQGPQGPPGPTGPPGGIYYVHTQTAAAAQWDIVHNLGVYPTVTLTDTGGSVIYGDVTYVSENHIVVVFSVAVPGTAYLT